MNSFVLINQYYKPAPFVLPAYLIYPPRTRLPHPCRTTNHLKIPDSLTSETNYTHLYLMLSQTYLSL